MDEASGESNSVGGHRYVGLTVIAAVAVLILFAFGGVSLLSGTHRLKLTAHFQNVQGLREGAPVRLAGVNIGTVRSVIAHPEVRDRPAEVVMALRTSYTLNIPGDSIASLSTAGVLGETLVDIDVSSATGRAINDGGELPTRESPHMSAGEMIEKFGTALKPKPCQPTDDEKKSSVAATK
jgi:phospholipid/cholesterol/gamma-HCH transport system substrate-binding protein